MGRTRKFADADVLERTAQLFRRRGYAATSLKELECETGLQPASLYHAFGNKKELFLRSLEAYHEAVVRCRIATHLKGKKPLAELENFFTSTYKIEGSPNAGCLLTNTATEVGGDDSDVCSAVAKGFEILRASFVRQLIAAKGAGLIPAQTKVEVTAEFLLTFYQGLLVRIRNGADETTLDQIVRTAMRSIAKIN